MTDNPALRAGIDGHDQGEAMSDDEWESWVDEMIPATHSNVRVAEAVRYTLYAAGAGAHLPVQQRARYRHDLANAVLRVIGGTDG